MSMKEEACSYLGVDISKGRLDLASLGENKEWSLPNDPRGWKNLIRQLVALGGKRVVVCEASGGYERGLISALQGADIAVALCNARQVRDYARACGLLAKTDRIDARVLARYGAHFEPRVLAAVRPEQRRLRELLLRHRQLTSARVSESNQAQHLDSPLLRRLSRGHLRLLERQLAQIDELIGQELATHHRAASAALTSVAGIGRYSAALLLAELPELGRASGGQIAALVGVAPFNHDSGAWRGQRHIRGGRIDLRRGLWMATLVAVRHYPPLRSFYQRLRQNGKPAKVALIAAMRKLLIILNAILRPLCSQSIHAS
jgi:transposase